MDSRQGSFWDHLEELRSVLLRVFAVVLCCTIIAFLLKEELFEVVLAPLSSSFPTFRLLGVDAFHIHLVNTTLTEQFMTHMRVAFYVGLLCASPYVIYLLFGFVSPGLYQSERRVAIRLVGSGYVMFVAGTLLNYFLIFPMTVRFLGTYSVSDDVTNMLTLQSYVDTLLMMSLMMGLVAELPVVCGLLGRVGLLTADVMRRYRRHAVVAVLIISAIITPTTDAFTLFVVALPVLLLYEISILIVKYTKTNNDTTN